MNWYISVLKNFKDFSGRAQRSEYWYFVLFNILISIGLTFIDVQTGTINAAYGFGLLSGIYCLVVLVPGIAVAVRRLHDIDKSGWWLLIALIPIIGALVLIYWCIQDSTPGSNQYGANPKGA